MGFWLTKESSSCCGPQYVVTEERPRMDQIDVPLGVHLRIGTDAIVSFCAKDFERVTGITLPMHEPHMFEIREVLPHAQEVTNEAKEVSKEDQP